MAREVAKAKFEEFVSDNARRRVFEQESLAIEATELIYALMESQEVSKADLAKMVGKSKAFITQLLGGSKNMTLHTLADLAFALGQKVEIQAAPLSRSGSGSETISRLDRNAAGWGHSPFQSVRILQPVFNKPAERFEEDIAA